MDHTVNLKGSNIEIIDLDPDVPEKSCIQGITNKYVEGKQAQHPFASQKLDEIINTGSVGLLQDKNIGSTTDTATPPKLKISKCLDSKTGKTLALIPIDYLKYCDMKDGKFRVKLNTLNKLQGQNSLLLYNVPEGNKDSSCIQGVNKISNESFVISNSDEDRNQKNSDIISLDKALEKMPPPEVISPKIQGSSNPVQSPNFIQKHNFSLSSIQSPISKMNVYNEKGNSSFMENIKKKIESKKLRLIKKRNSSIKVTSFIPPFITSKAGTPKYSIHKCRENDRPKSKYNKRMKNGKRIEINGEVRNTSIDLTEEQDSLVLPSNMNESSKYSPGCTVYPRVYQEHPNHFIQSKALTDDLSQLVKEKVYFVSRNSSTCKLNSGIDYGEKVSNFPNSSHYNDASECDPLGDLPNIFEPIVTLNEADDTQNTLENTLTEGLRGGGIPNKKIDELETMIQNNTITSPFKVMIPSQYLKYCTKKNGKYLVDLSALKRINKEKRETIGTGTDCLISHKNLVEEKDQLKQKERILHLNRHKFNNSSPKSIVDQPMLPDQCRYFYLKGSAWDKLDLTNNQCKGFNEREVNISKICSQKFTTYVNNAKTNNEKFRTDLYIAKLDRIMDMFSPHEMIEDNSFSDLSCNDLFFTKKIDILDKKGRRVRTEHVDFNETIASYDREKCKKQKLENSFECMLSKIKSCNIVIERNEIVEAKIKSRMEQEKIRKKLNSKFLKTSTLLNKDISRPTIILNKNNIHIIRLDEKFCKKCNVMFVKNYEDDFSESIYKNTLFINLVEKNLIKITSPSVLQDYFTLKAIIKKL